METFLEYTNRSGSSKDPKINKYLKTKASRSVVRSYLAVQRNKNTNDKLDHVADLLVALKAEGK